MLHRLISKLSRTIKGNFRVIVIAIGAIGCLGIAASSYASIAAVTPPFQPIPNTPLTKKKASDLTAKPTSETQPEVTTQPVQATPTQKASPTSSTVKRRGDSTNPEWMACQAKVNDLYVTYNSENARINQEKNAALAEVDRMYYAGELANFGPDGTYLEPYEQTNAWQAARSMLSDEYASQLQTLYQEHLAKWDAQLAVCELTHDH